MENNFIINIQSFNKIDILWFMAKHILEETNFTET